MIEIRVLWQRTDYGYISVAAARGYGGRELGSYQDAITDEKFAKIRREQAEDNPDWPLVEAVVKVPAAEVEALFTDGTAIEAVEDPPSEGNQDWTPSGTFDTGHQPPRQRWDHPTHDSEWTDDPDPPSEDEPGEREDWCWVCKRHGPPVNGSRCPNQGCNSGTVPTDKQEAIEWVSARVHTATAQEPRRSFRWSWASRPR